MGFPRRLLPSDPLFSSGERAFLERAGADSADFLAGDPAALFEESDVFHEGGQGHVERFGQLADACRPSAESGQNSSPRGIRQCVEHSVELVRMLSHKAKYQLGDC